MRGSIMGILPPLSSQGSLKRVAKSASSMCKITHYDPRCVASSVAVAVAIALCLCAPPHLLVPPVLPFAQRETRTSSKVHSLTSEEEEEEEEEGPTVTKAELQLWKEHRTLIDHIMNTAFEYAAKELKGNKEKSKKEAVEELRRHMFAEHLHDLKLAEKDKIGYTLKALGAGFYAFNKGFDFEETITEIVLEAGDADSNAAVAGSLLGCKLGFSNITEAWVGGLLHKDWLEGHVGSVLRFYS